MSEEDSKKKVRSDRRRKRKSQANEGANDSVDSASDGGFVLIIMAIAVAVVIGALLWFLTSSRPGNILGGGAVGAGSAPAAGNISDVSDPPLAGGRHIGPMRPAVTIETSADTVTALKRLASQYSSSQ